MAKKTVKKVDVKKVMKMEVNSQISVMLTEMGIGVEDGVNFGFTEGTLIAHMEKCDIQIKLIAPKAGIDRYVNLSEEVEEVAETEELPKTEEVK